MLDLVVPIITPAKVSLTDIERLDKELEQYFRDKFLVQSALTRPLVSFQANKSRPIYRWYKYKEAFSATLVEYLFHKYGVTRGRCLDPFAGSGTALFAASALGIDADGIELLPIGQQIISTKKVLENEFTAGDFETLRRWAKTQPWQYSEKQVALPELRITKGAYPEYTRASIEKYLGACEEENGKVQAVLRFVLLCVLESISFTRKDGQYLRWDYRSGRRQGKKPFNKGEITDFERALSEKINEVLADLQPANKQGAFFPATSSQGKIRLYNGSCLRVMPTLECDFYDAVITSPPYCNRYDYTRTYALELALMGTDEKGLSNLRQEMLSCTVENRAKDLLKMNALWAPAISTTDGQQLLQYILKYLDNKKTERLLNNSGIPRMVKGYFYEMACVILECARVLKPNAPLFMVNDNVRYAGASISVDMILSSLAANLGFRIENILVLPDGKGNSSQQMGEHGRKELRKCVYVWRKS
ncbi:MAG: site-specific DNA-methyltransferase [Chloroflexi bacterium]|nr:site-specific DNA-methyltransferase [Chloroflexota bacterium]